MSDTAESDGEDPFACFGSDSSSSSNDDEQEGWDAVVAQQQKTADEQALERSQYLVERSNNASSAQQQGIPCTCLPLSSDNYQVFDSVSAAGKGLQALKAFTTGEEILRERAAMRIPNQQAATSLAEAEQMHKMAVQQGFANLHPATKAAVLELSNCDGHIDIADNVSIPIGIYQTNSYRLGENEPYGGLFLTIARLNHSCRPNCHHMWRPDLKKMLVFATRDINAGEELYTTYGPSQCLDTAGRQAYLLERFSFTCGCEMCLENNKSGGDDRMLKLDALQEDISLLAASGNPTAALETIEQCLVLIKEQNIETGAMIKPILHHGYQIAMGGLGDKALAHSYLSQELVAVNNSEGIDSPRAMEIQLLLDGPVFCQTSPTTAEMG